MRQYFSAFPHWVGGNRNVNTIDECRSKIYRNRVFDCQFCRLLLVFPDLRNRECLTDYILSHETVGPYLISYFFKCFKVILLGHGFHELLTNEHSLKYNQSDYLAIIFESYPSAAFLKSVSIFVKTLSAGDTVQR